MLFAPVRIAVSAGGQDAALYHSGIGLLGRKLTAYELSLGDMSRPLGEVAADLNVNIIGAFASQGAWNGFGGWTALSERYGGWKERRAPGTPILVGVTADHKGSREHPSRPGSYRPSGRMREEMTSPGSYRVGPRSMLYAPPTDYAGYHLTGTSRMPARPQIELSVETLHLWDGFFGQWLTDLARELQL